VAEVAEEAGVPAVEIGSGGCDVKARSTLGTGSEVDRAGDHEVVPTVAFVTVESDGWGCRVGDGLCVRVGVWHGEREDGGGHMEILGSHRSGVRGGCSRVLGVGGAVGVDQMQGVEAERRVEGPTTETDDGPCPRPVAFGGLAGCADEDVGVFHKGTVSGEGGDRLMEDVADAMCAFVVVDDVFQAVAGVVPGDGAGVDLDGETPEDAAPGEGEGVELGIATDAVPVSQNDGVEACGRARDRPGAEVVGRCVDELSGREEWGAPGE
jgi:hypothetical protein